MRLIEKNTHTQRCAERKKREERNKIVKSLLLLVSSIIIDMCTRTRKVILYSIVLIEHLLLFLRRSSAFDSIEFLMISSDFFFHSCLLTEIVDEILIDSVIPNRFLD